MHLQKMSLPRIVKEPTGWIVLLLVAGFLYVQWPTRQRPIDTIHYVDHALDSGFSASWEAPPQMQRQASPQVFGLKNKGIHFLVQSDALTGDFTALVQKVAEQDQKNVGGAVQEAMVLEADFASYAYFDAENRIQSHRWYLRDQQWVKVSVLYKSSQESQQARADYFLSQAGFR